MSSRDSILSAINTANCGIVKPKEPPAIPVWHTVDDPDTRFQFEWERNGGEWFDASIDTKTVDKLTQFFPEGTVALTDGLPLPDTFLSTLPKRFVLPMTDTSALADATGSIATCDLLLAETGTIAVSSRVGQPRGLTLLPPAILFVVTREQFIGNLEEAIARLQTEAPHGWVWISGPSRTADIEKVLVKGVHGPKRVGVWLINHS